MSTDLATRLLTRIVQALGTAAGLDEVDTSPAAVATVASQDLFSGTATIQGIHLDSLALTEVLVQAEEEIGISLFDDDRVDAVETLADLVAVVASQVDETEIIAWLKRTDPSGV